MLGAGGVFGRELDVVAIAGGPLHAGDGPLDDLLLGHLQLELAMDGAGGQEDVDPRLLGVLRRLPRRGRCPRRCSGPGRRSPVRESSPAISRTASKSPGEAIGKPASIMSTPRSTSAWAISSFSCRFMLAPGRLLAVAQRRVENLDLSQGIRVGCHVGSTRWLRRTSWKTWGAGEGKKKPRSCGLRGGCVNKDVEYAAPNARAAWSIEVAIEEWKQPASGCLA